MFQCLNSIAVRISDLITRVSKIKNTISFIVIDCLVFAQNEFIIAHPLFENFLEKKFPSPALSRTTNIFYRHFYFLWCQSLAYEVAKIAFQKLLTKDMSGFQVYTNWTPAFLYQRFYGIIQLPFAAKLSYVATKLS